MSQDFHKCAVSGCNHQVKLDLLMCRRHWFMVPAGLRDKLMETWRQGTNVQYIAARRACVEAVEQIRGDREVDRLLEGRS
jgi:hypothetical protein